MKLNRIILFTLIFFNSCFSLSNPIIQSSVMVVDLTHPKILHSENENLRLIPASTTKLFTSSAALRQLGVNYHFNTQIYIRGKLTNRVLNGDLIFYGMGDPALNNEELWSLANTLKQTGLKQIKGRIIINTSNFGKIIYRSSDRLAAQVQTENSYDSLLNSSGSDFGAVGIGIFTPDNTQPQPLVTMVPFNLSNIVLNNYLTISANTTKIHLIRQTKDDKEYLTLSGTISNLPKPLILYRSVGNPSILTGHLLRGFLAQQGIQTTNQITTENKPLLTSDRLLLSFSNPRLLPELLQNMLRYSNNYMADMITLTIWRAEQNQIPSVNPLSVAAESLIKNYQQIAPTSSFYNSTLGLPHLDSGSGITETNRISAHDLIVLLDGMYHDKANFPVFIGALPNLATVAKLFKLDPTTLWSKKVFVKPGSFVENPPVLAVAGYFYLKNGDLGAFAIMLNQAQPGKLSQTILPSEVNQQLQQYVMPLVN